MTKEIRMIKEPNGGPRLFSSFGFCHSSFEESHFRFRETAL